MVLLSLFELQKVFRKNASARSFKLKFFVMKTINVLRQAIHQCHMRMHIIFLPEYSYCSKTVGLIIMHLYNINDLI